MMLLIQLSAFRQVASCLFHMGGENLGFRDAGKQLFRAACVALAISRLSGHHPLIPKQRFQELLMIEWHRLLSCFHFPWRKEYLASVVSLMTALQLSWFFLLSSWRCSWSDCCQEARRSHWCLPTSFCPPLEERGWMKQTTTSLMGLSLHCVFFRG